MNQLAVNYVMSKQIDSGFLQYLPSNWVIVQSLAPWPSWTSPSSRSSTAEANMVYEVQMCVKQLRTGSQTRSAAFVTEILFLYLSNFSRGHKYNCFFHVKSFTNVHLARLQTDYFSGLISSNIGLGPHRTIVILLRQIPRNPRFNEEAANCSIKQDNTKKE